MAALPTCTAKHALTRHYAYRMMRPSSGYRGAWMVL